MIIILKSGLLRRIGKIPQEVIAIVQHAVDEIILQETESENLSVKNETHEKIDDEVEKDQLYDPDKLSLDEKKWCKRVFESKLIYIYDMKILNSINCTHNSKVNNISEWNLLHDILNPYKHTENINIHYSPILHGCKNIHKGRAEFKNFESY